MTVDQIVSYYPRLYHMANAGVWGSIRQRGLLSTTALLDLYGVSGATRYRIESCHRPKSVELCHPNHGRVTIRDQAPMRPSQLEKCLDGMTCREWYELLNRKAFLWATAARVQALLGAKLYRNGEHTVITIDTRSFLSAHSGSTSLSPINSGSTLYKPVRRGRFTFLPIAEYPFEDRRKKRGIANAIAELAVDYSIPDLVEHTIAVERMSGGDLLEVLYSRTVDNADFGH